MVALLKYNYKLYRKCNKFIIPLLVFGLFQQIYYSGGSVDFTSGMIMCCNLSFCIMAWMGFSYCESQDWRTEQIAFLKVKGRNIYWISKILFMWLIGIVLSLVGVIWPLIINSISNSTSLGNKVMLNDVLLGFLIQILAALMGVLVGMIFQVKVIGNRNMGVMIILLYALLSIVKGPLIKSFPFAKLITWLLSPIYNVTNSLMVNGKSSLDILAIPVMYCLIYILIQIFIYIKLMKKILF